MLTGIILIRITAWVASAHLKHCSVGLEIPFWSCRQLWRSSQLLWTRKKKKRKKKRSHLGTFTCRRHLQQLRRRRRGCVFEEERRSLHGDIGLCQSCGATSAGVKKKRNNRRSSSVQNCTSCAWQKSLLDKPRTLWRETASHFLFPPQKKKCKVIDFLFGYIFFFPSSF